jgi:hypothetical protein
LAFGGYSSGSIAKEILKKIKTAGFSPDKSGVRIAMLAVLFGQGEVLVIVIATAILVFILLRRRKR